MRQPPMKYSVRSTSPSGIPQRILRTFSGLLQLGQSMVFGIKLMCGVTAFHPHAHLCHQKLIPHLANFLEVSARRLLSHPVRMQQSQFCGVSWNFRPVHRSRGNDLLGDKVRLTWSEGTSEGWQVIKKVDKFCPQICPFARNFAR